MPFIDVVVTFTSAIVASSDSLVTAATYYDNSDALRADLYA